MAQTVKAQVTKPAKKGPYRKTTVVTMVKDHSALKKGKVVECHPVMADRLVAKGVAVEGDQSKKTTKSE